MFYSLFYCIKLVQKVNTMQTSRRKEGSMYSYLKEQHHASSPESLNYGPEEMED